MKVKEAIKVMRSRLVEVMDAAEARAVTGLIIEEVMGYSAVDVVLRGDSELPEFIPPKIEAICARLCRHEPVQYVLGKARFHGHSFAVTPAVLIPRCETEQLVDLIVDENTGTDLRVLDIGTGSGCIAISLARALKFATITATDVSADALAVAQANAQALNAKVRFVNQDILCACAPSEPCYDIIVSNPPYVLESERATMERNVLDYEPAGALWVPDDDPLRFYTAIARYAKSALVQGGKLYLECNRRFTGEVAAMLATHGFDAEVRRDSFDAPRFVTATLER